MILSFHPWLIPMGVILFFGTFFTTHYVSLGSLLVYAGFMIELVSAIFSSIPKRHNFFSTSLPSCPSLHMTSTGTTVGAATSSKSHLHPDWTLGTKAGLIVLLGDIMKCILAIVLTNMLFQNSHPDEISRE